MRISLIFNTDSGWAAFVLSFPFRHIFKNKKHIQIRLAEVNRIFPDNDKISTGIGDFDYDFLVIAIGCKTNFFGNNEICRHSFTLKTTYDAIKIRNHILKIFEKIFSLKEEEREAYLNLVIVGAGATGVELAGAFAEIKKNVLPKDYPRIDFTKFQIHLVEGSKNTLNNMSDNAKNASQKYLQKMGVQLLTEKFVTEYNGNTVTLSNGDKINTKTVIWAAGVTGKYVDDLPAECFTNVNRIKVNRINKVVGSENIFAIGDIAYMETPKYTKGHPQVANVDIKLILSVRNKLIIFINWAWAYITKDSSLRLILTENRNPCGK